MLEVITGRLNRAVGLNEVLSFDYRVRGAFLRDEYLRNAPFPNIVIDNFFAPAVAEGIAQKVSNLRDEEYRVSFRSLAQNKLQLGKVGAAIPGIYPVYAALMGGEFVQFAETLSGFSGLQADSQFAGAGLHRYHRHGFSEIHLDSNRHPFDLDLIHRLNLLIFLNPVWNGNWGGELVLWSDRNEKPSPPTVTIAPVFNRCVLFSVSDKSWHSVNRISCPADLSRNSIVIYYFNRQPLAEDTESRSVIWHSKRSKPRQAIFEITNRVISRAKPYARYLRWLRPSKFDGI
jgi:hypothetical protein